ncbi:Hsp33 family molecular chaperone HslO [Paenibacillus lautus]|uniref:Hsp33 family molecular chaperone HslO n=1 Tax=Paenibacillus lautus TaxID=1401 RepID=UPI003D26BC5F
MQNGNFVLQTLAYNHQVRILFVENTELLNDMCHPPSMHKLLKTAWGQTITSACLIIGTLKDNQRLSLKIKFSNARHKIFADVDSMGNVRGYLSDELVHITPDQLNHIHLKQIVGDKGSIHITKDLGMNSLFTGITDMPYRNIIDDLSHYYQQSEQTSTDFYSYIQFNENEEIVLSRGIMVQLLPGCPPHRIQQIKKELRTHQYILADKSNGLMEIPGKIFKDIEIVGSIPIQHFCGCSKEVLYPILHSLEKKDLKYAVMKAEPIELVCHICGSKYDFEPHEIAGLL